MKRILFLVAALLCLYSSTAKACAILEEAIPKVGHTVKAPVNTVVLRFSLGVTPSSSTIDVTDAKGNKVNVGQAFAGDAADKGVIATKVRITQPGVYKVHWNVLAACGSQEPGNYKFTVGIDNN